MKSLVMVLSVALYFTGISEAVECDVKITFDGKGAGQVVFDGAVHALKGFTCSDCHERHGLTPALFEMKNGANAITMRKMEMGRSCGSCHEVRNLSSCSKCHSK